MAPPGEKPMENVVRRVVTGGDAGPWGPAWDEGSRGKVTLARRLECQAEAPRGCLWKR